MKSDEKPTSQLGLRLALLLMALFATIFAVLGYQKTIRENTVPTYGRPHTQPKTGSPATVEKLQRIKAALQQDAQAPSLADEWGRPIRVVIRDFGEVRRMDVVSGGPDGVIGNYDDVVLRVEGRW